MIEIFLREEIDGRQGSVNKHDCIRLFQKLSTSHCRDRKAQGLCFRILHTLDSNLESPATGPTAGASPKLAGGLRNDSSKFIERINLNHIVTWLQKQSKNKTRARIKKRHCNKCGTSIVPNHSQA